MVFWSAAKGGGRGYGGVIRQSGGKIGERGAVLEDGYFHKKVGRLLTVTAIRKRSNMQRLGQC